jgi:hypothetical protein
MLTPKKCFLNRKGLSLNKGYLQGSNGELYPDMFSAFQNAGFFENPIWRRVNKNNKGSRSGDIRIPP